MKKIEYKTPEMLVIKMKSEGMLCASPGEETIGGGGGGFAPEFESDEFDIGSELEEYKTEI
jgi:hypothetical protein